MICMARTLGAPLTVPAGEGGFERVDPVGAVGEPAAHRRDHVDDVRVQLHLHELVDLDAARRAHPAQVVAPQIDQHDVLGPLLLVGTQIGDQAPVFGGVGARGRVPAMGRVWTMVTLHGDERLRAEPQRAKSSKAM